VSHLISEGLQDSLQLYGIFGAMGAGNIQLGAEWHFRERKPVFAGINW
jgi:hypothetical protein